MEVSIEKGSHYSEFRLMSIRIWIGCCTSCAKTEFGGISAEFYRHPRFPALSTTNLKAPCSLPIHCPQAVNDSDGNEGLSYSGCSSFDVFPVDFFFACAIELRVLAKFGCNAVVPVHYAYWRIERWRRHDTACTHLGRQH